MPRRTPPAPRDVAARYDAQADRYDATRSGPVMQQRWAIIEAPLLAVARGADAVLDLGCGTGRLLRQLRAPHRIGVDISAGMLRNARRHGLAVARADAHALPFRDASFDAIVAGNIAFRYLRYDEAFAECARVLRSGGRLALHQYAAHTWTLQALVRPPEVTAGLHLSSPDELIPPARRAGLRPIGFHLFRTIRFPPYAVRIPGWLPGRWWRHCVAAFQKG